jgi:hypothetical protein
MRNASKFASAGAVLMLALFVFAMLVPSDQAVAQAGCTLSLTCPFTQSNGQSGVIFEITALRSTSLCRFWLQPSSTGSHTVQVWKHPGGMINANDGLWQYIGSATITMSSSSSYYELPVDLNMLLNVGEKWGFAVFSSSTIRYDGTGSTPLTLSDSYISVNRTGYGITGSATPPSTTSWSFGFYPRGFVGQIYYKEGCYFPANTSSCTITDAGGNPIAYTTLPGTVYAQYMLSYPAGASNLTLTVTFKKVGVASPVSPTSMYTATLTDTKAAGVTLNGLKAINLPSTLEPGFYNVEITGNSQNSCLNYANFTLPSTSMMLVLPGTTPCSVWPGDVNNDGVVNYGDRKSLNQYIYDANLRSTWLSGPARYMASPGPLSFLAWTPQASVPWNTDMGCYMDADGNGAVNNFDYVGIKLNWMRSHATPKNISEPAPSSFDMSQNFPNPFNPSTRINYSAPEQARVYLTVVDMTGKSVAMLVDQTVDAGTHEVVFDATNLASGQYIATIAMTGMQTGTTFTKTVKMTLSK